MRDDKKHSSAKIKMLGLSLIEVMVAVTIFSFLSVSLYMLLRTGIFVRKRLSVDGRNREKSYLVLERVSRELRNAVKFTNRETGFFGKGDSLKFYALTFDYAHNLPRVSALSYEFKDGALKRTSAPPLKEADDKEIVNVSLLNNLDKFAISYFSKEKNDWQDEWEDGRIFPRGLKITIGYKDGRGRARFWDKYVFIYR